MAWLGRNQLLLLGLAVLALLAALLVRDLSQSDPPTLVLQDSPTSGDSVLVHIAAAVAAPGVYELPHGARVQDAILAAGGGLPKSDTESLNLARRLRDGEKIDVPGPVSDVAATVATLAPGQKLDLNAATLEQLDQLPGIGEAYSRRIVDSRVVDGPYEAVEDLLTRRVIPAATLEQIRDRLTVSTP